MIDFKRYKKAIMNTPLCTGLSEEETTELILADTYTTESFQPDAFLMRRESEQHRLGILLKGTAVVKRRLGNGQMHMSRLSESDLYGAVSLFSTKNKGYIVDIQCVTECKVLFLTEQQLLCWMQKSETVLRNYLIYLNGRIRFLNQRLDALTKNSVPMKIMTYLASVSEDGTYTVRSYVELAETLALSRATMYRALDTLSEEGKILREGKTITILEELL